jgi:nicotinate-nucleotide adenylyltransferase
VLGGTFDPVHNAHLAIARAALEQLGLGTLLWIPTGTPGYRKPALASGADRVAMLRLALASEPRYAIDEFELQAGASGFTYDTVKALKEKSPHTEIVLLMGADQYAKRATWHRWPALAKLCRIAVIERPDWPGPEGEIVHLRMTPIDISASDIRARIARGEDVSGMLPAPVLGYIRAHGLYR